MNVTWGNNNGGLFLEMGFIPQLWKNPIGKLLERNLGFLETNGPEQYMTSYIQTSQKLLPIFKKSAILVFFAKSAKTAAMASNLKI